jgi:hypothetical protein
MSSDTWRHVVRQIGASMSEEPAGFFFGVVFDKSRDVITSWRKSGKATNSLRVVSPCSPWTLINNYHTTRRHILDSCNCNNHRSKNFKFPASSVYSLTKNLVYDVIFKYSVALILFVLYLFITVSNATFILARVYIFATCFYLKLSISGAHQFCKNASLYTSYFRVRKC